MKLEDTEIFRDYHAYKVFHKKMRRWQVCLVLKTDSKIRRTLTYAKYLMSIAHNRILEREEEVDHIDGNRINDTLSNLQILTKEEHKIKSYAERTPAAYVQFNCKYCTVSFLRRKNVSKPALDRGYAYCSVECMANGYRK